MNTTSKIVLLTCIFFLAILPVVAKKRVACVGNSITENYALSDQDKYPSILQTLLGEDYEVKNYGIGGRTVLKKGNHPYWIEERYQEVLEWNPEIVIIKMGTNDGKPENWKHSGEFENDYIEFVNSFRALASNPSIYVCYPLPTFDNNSLPVADSVIVKEMIPKIKVVAQKTKSKIIDLHHPMEGREDFVYDKVHPNAKGTQVMARVVAKAICPKRNFPQPANGKPANIIFIGNSITEGTYLASPPPAIAASYLDSLGYEVHYANCGISGFTTVDFQPESKGYSKILVAADSLSKNMGQLIFSIKLGTNDSACSGTSGAPISPEQYGNNLQKIIDELYKRYPSSCVLLHYPIWYSPNTHNNAVYLQEGLNRLQTYFPVIKNLVSANKDYVTLGDTKGFKVFQKNYEKYHKPQSGNSGIYYLHPNEKGAKILGNIWGQSIFKLLKKKH